MSNFNASMKRLASAALVFALAMPVQAQMNRRDEQDAALKATRRGSVHSLRDIESDVVPAMKRRGASYIGAEYDSDALRYRLKFVRGSSVIWIDVDGRSGQIIAQAGN
ncbi:MAG: hypothetical protein RJB22_1885 [Pseudomonadota bacterium]